MSKCDAITPELSHRHWGEILGPEMDQVNERRKVDRLSASQLAKNRDFTNYAPAPPTAGVLSVIAWFQQLWKTQHSWA
jgi:hypothetical protein